LEKLEEMLRKVLNRSWAIVQTSWRRRKF